MYYRVPTEKELAGTGYSPEDYAPDPVDVWPENYDAYCLFCSVQTQWRVDMGVRIGLDYNVLYHRMDRMKLPAAEYEQLEADIQVMEFEALETMSKSA